MNLIRDFFADEPHAQRHRALVGLALVLSLAVYFVSTLWGLRFTQEDDYYFALKSVQNEIALTTVRTALDYGRVQFFAGLPIVMWVQGMADTVWFDVLHFGTLFVTFVLFLLALWQFTNLGTALLALTLLCSNMVISWHQTMLVTAPLWFFASFACVLASLLLLRLAQTKQSRALYILSLFLLVVSYVSQEYQPPLATLAWIVVLLSNPDQSHLSFRARLYSQKNWGLAVISLFGLYIALYVVFRLTVGTVYHGASVEAGNFDLLSFLKVLITFSLSGSSLAHIFYPTGFNYYDAISDGMQYLYVWPPANGWSELLHIRYAISAFAAVIASAIAFSLRPRPSGATTLLLVLLGSAMAFLPSFLMAVTPTYQSWAKAGVITCTYTPFSFFGVVLACGSILLYLRDKLHGVAQKLLTCLALVIIGIGAWAAAYHNEKITSAMNYNADRWRSVHALFGQPETASQLEGKTIWAPNLWSFYWSTPVQNNYWHEYVAGKYQRQINFLRTTPSAKMIENQSIWYMDYYRLTACNMLAVIAGKMKLVNEILQIENPILVTNASPRHLQRHLNLSWMNEKHQPLRGNWQQLPHLNNKNNIALLPSASIDPATLHLDCEPKNYGPAPLASYQWGETINLIANNAYAVRLTEGWSISEPTHHWTDGKQARISIMDPPRASRTVRATISVAPFTAPPTITTQPVTVTVNGVKIGKLVIDHGQIGAFASHTFTIPTRTWNAAPSVEIDFDLPNASSPASLGIGGDQRLLGLAFKDLRFDQQRIPSEAIE